MIGRSDDRHINYHTDNKVGFMAKELLSGYRATPPANNAKQQQSGLRYSAPGPARCHFIRTVHYQRHYVGEQKPYNKGMRGENAA